MEKQEIIKELERRIASFEQLPYLFVGTGLSMRYSHAPDWDSLLFEIWNVIYPEKTKRDYDKLKQKIERSIDSDFEYNYALIKHFVNPEVASVIEEEFNQNYYSENGFDISVFSDYENEDILNGHYNPFKYLVAKKTKKLKLDESLSAFREISYLIENQNKIAGIITTNYDQLLERIFKDFSVLVGQDNMLVTRSFGIFEIFKIHGDCSSPNSLVITKKDYDRFREKLKYLSAKLLTIFVEHPIIFIGYGLGDFNIMEILKEIAECLTKKQLDRIRENFIFISPAFGESESYSKNTINWGNSSIVMNEFVLEDYGDLYRLLGKIQSSMPVKLARKLQDMVCNYVYSSRAQNNVLFGDINSPEIDDNKTAIFFGKAETVTNIGFSYFTIEEILEDVLFNNKPYLLSTQLIEKTFKNIRASAGSTILPIYKYIKTLNYPKEKIPNNYNIIKGYDDINIQPTASDKKSYIKSDITFFSIEEIEKSYPNHIPKQAANIKQFIRNIEVNELEKYLKEKYELFIQDKYKSLFKKLVAIYDFKRYSGIK